MRVVIADDNLLVRDGLATLLEDAGVEVAARMSSAEELMREVDAHEPDVAIVDVRMPPSYTDEGLQAAHAIRERHPRMGIMILSQHVEVGMAMRLLAESPPASSSCGIRGPGPRCPGSPGRAPTRRRPAGTGSRTPARRSGNAAGIP